MLNTLNPLTKQWKFKTNTNNLMSDVLEHYPTWRLITTPFLLLYLFSLIIFKNFYIHLLYKNLINPFKLHFLFSNYKLFCSKSNNYQSLNKWNPCTFNSVYFSYWYAASIFPQKLDQIHPVQKENTRRLIGTLIYPQ